MKRNFSFLVLSLLVLIGCDKDEEPTTETVFKNPNQVACIPDNLDASVLAFYSFSNGSLKDISGLNHQLKVVGNVQLIADRMGNSNCAFLFNHESGQNEFLYADGSFLNNLGDFSVSLWYQPTDSIWSGDEFQTLVARDSVQQCPNKSGVWSLGIYDCRRGVFGGLNSIWDNTIVTNFSCEAEVNARVQSWAHMVGTYNSTTKEMSLYRNGVLQGKVSGFANCAGNQTSSMQEIGNLFLGKDYTGKLDDVVILKKVLSSSEVTQLFQLSPCCSN